ncbi:MAG TPA: AI-2E family transporter [Candidatus Methanofastidiosa archaeon]|nr:AI-2E family transporter [Candidatus Methanofastidiosa archaeon]
MEKRLTEIAAIVAFVILIYFGIKTISPIIDAFVMAIVITYLIRPMHDSINRKVSNKGVSVFISMFFMIIPLTFIGLYTLNELVSTFQKSDISLIIGESITNADELMEYITERVMFFIDFDTLSQSTIDTIQAKATELGGVLYDYALNLTLGIPVLLFKLLLSLVMSFYFLRDSQRIIDKMCILAPVNFRDKFTQLIRSIDIIFQAVIIGYLFKAIFTGIISVIVYYLLGLPHALLLGIFTGMIDFIPIIGPWMIQVTLFLWYIYQGQYQYALVVLATTYVFISLIPEMYIRPRISGDAANIHPLIILAGAIGGLFAFGAIGVIVGPMILGILFVVLRIYFYNEPYQEIKFGYKDTLVNFVKGVFSRDNQK